MNYGESQTIFTVSAILKAGRTHYCTPSPQTMQKLLGKYHNRKRSLQTYWRDIKSLEDNKYITRQARWNTTDKQSPKRKSSMITLTIKGAKYLVKMGNAWAGQCLGAMIKWAKRGDKRFPRNTTQRSGEPNNYEAELKEIRDRAMKPCIV